MSEEKTPGQIAFAAHYRRSVGELAMPESWDIQPDGVREDWEATAYAVRGPHVAALLTARDALRGIALGTVNDPSVTADMALVAIRHQLGALLPDGWDERAKADL